MNDRLLTDEELNTAILGRPLNWAQVTEPKLIREVLRREWDTRKPIMEAQDAKTASIYQQKIVREILMEPSDELLEIGRKAIEDVLVEWRDSRLSEFNRGNGLVVREKDGCDSSIIRFGPEAALRIGMKAIGQALKQKLEAK